MNATTWAEKCNEQIPAWVRAFVPIARKLGHDADDLAQEGRFALLEADRYINDKARDQWGNGLSWSEAVALCRVIVKRAIKRLLFRKRRLTVKDGDYRPGHDDMDKSQREQDELFMRIEVSEMVDAAPEEIRLYLTDLFSGRLPLTNREFVALHREVRAAAAEYVLNWVSRYNFAEESK